MVRFHRLIPYGLALAFLELATGTAINVTHDDSNIQALYSTISFIGPWSHQQVAICNGTDHCTDPLSRTNNGTWSTSIYVKNSRLVDTPPSVTFTFYGTAVYVNCVLIPHDMLGIAANSDMFFMLDGVVSSHFHHPAPKSGEIKATTALYLESLSKDRHTLRIQNGAEDGNTTQNISVLTLDSIIYTTDDNPTAFNTAPNILGSFSPEQRKKKARILVAAVVSSLAGVGIVLLSFWLCYRRKQRKPLLPSLPTVFRHRSKSTSRTMTPYPKKLSSFTSLRAPSLQSVGPERGSDGDDDVRSVFSNVPPSYHSRSSTIP